MGAHGARGCHQAAAAKLGWSVNDVDLWEINEAFAVQLVATHRELKLPWTASTSTAAPSLGHPIAPAAPAHGHPAARPGTPRQAARIAALCLGGGNAIAMAVERV